MTTFCEKCNYFSQTSYECKISHSDLDSVQRGPYAKKHQRSAQATVLYMYKSYCNYLRKKFKI